MKLLRAWTSFFGETSFSCRGFAVVKWRICSFYALIWGKAISVCFICKTLTKIFLEDSLKAIVSDETQ